MQKTIRPAIVVILVLAVLGIVGGSNLFLPESADAAVGTHWFQGSGSTTQSLGTTPEAAIVDQDDGGVGILRPSNTEFLITKTGTYFILGAAQTGRSCPGAPADFTFWLRVNGQDADNSNVLLSVTKEIRDVIVSQSVLDLNDGDVVEFMAASSSDNACIEMQAIQPVGQPLVPSLIVSIIEQ